MVLVTNCTVLPEGEKVKKDMQNFFVIFSEVIVQYLPL